jgi:hypothetical protein
MREENLLTFSVLELDVHTHWNLYYQFSWISGLRQELEPSAVLGLQFVDDRYCVENVLPIGPEVPEPL